MNECIACNSENVQRAKTDFGFIKLEGKKPLRMYLWRCNDCGFIMMHAAEREG